MSGHRVFGDLAEGADAGQAILEDPGTGGVLQLIGSYCTVSLTVAAAAETRSLPTAAANRLGPGKAVYVVVNQLTTAGTHYVTIEGIRLSTEGDWVLFVSMKVNDAVVWRAVARGGAVPQASVAPVTLSTSLTLTRALHANRPLLMNGAGGARTYTLPPATGTGDWYRFYVKAINTSNYIISAASSGEYYQGTVLGVDVGATPDYMTPFTVVPADTFFLCTLNGTTTGGVAVGDWVEFLDEASGLWMVRGVLTNSGAEGTPFAN